MESIVPSHQAYSDLSVLGLRADEAACGNFRISSPLHFLAQGGAKTEVFSGFSFQMLRDYDFILAQRQHSRETRDFLQQAKWMGKTVIYELDDNIHAIHPNSVVFDSYRPGSEVLHSMEAILAICDGMFTTSAELASQYAPLNKRTWVIPNFLDYGLRDWETPAERPESLQGKIVIGWSGSITHQDDAAVMGESLARVLAKYPQTVFALCSAYQTMEIFVRQLQVPAERIVRIEPVTFDRYPSIPSHFDISLCPLLNTTFNRAKSDLKIKEAGAWGVPYVATRIAPYLRFHLDSGGQGGYLAEGAGEWEQAISRLVEDEADRRARGEFLRTLLRTEHGMEKNVYRWAEALREARDLTRFAPEFERKISVREKPGRNDACPCGSGSKYKRCCVPAFG